jgi:hypothetical protein
MYQRKTRDEYQVFTHTLYGKEEVYASDDRKDARDRLKEYRANQPEFAHSLKKVRIRISEIG